MPYNLLRERWLPVRRLNGTRDRIRPCDITDYLTTHRDNPIIAVDSDRADFTYNLDLFIIALLQTFLPPENKNSQEWKQRWINPPTPEELQAAFCATPEQEAVFNLDGDGYRFMQDGSLSADTSHIKSEPSRGEWDMSKLLIDGFGAGDMFMKYGEYLKVSYPTAAAALITHQWNTTSSAAGSKNQHRSSLRNGGFLTTLLRYVPSKKEHTATLWQHCWLNVMDKQTFEGYCGNAAHNELSDQFPWMGAIRNSNPHTGGSDSLPHNTNPYHMLWGTPRRVYLRFDQAHPSECDIQPNGKEATISSFYVKPDGYNYVEWKHPYSPLWLDDSLQPKGFMKTDAEGIRYSQWLGLIKKKEITDKKGTLIKTLLPAKIVHYHEELQSYFGRHRKDIEAKILAFGYANDNAKIITFRVGEMPLFSFDTVGQRETVAHYAEEAIKKAENFGYALENQSKALYGGKEYKEKDSGKGFEWKDTGRGFSTAAVKAMYWSRTEPAFYSLLEILSKAAKEGAEPGDEIFEKVISEWQKTVQRITERIFDEIYESIPLSSLDLRSALQARKELTFAFSEKNKNN